MNFNIKQIKCDYCEKEKIGLEVKHCYNHGYMSIDDKVNDLPIRNIRPSYKVNNICIDCLNKKSETKHSVIIKDVEEMASIQHDIWSHWMKYMFLKKQVSQNKLQDLNGFNYQGRFWKKEDLERWERQMHTPYSELSEEEKESDIKIVKKFILKIGENKDE